MQKFWKVLPWFLLMAVILLIPAFFGGVIAVVGDTASCGQTAAWWAWLRLCIAGTYVMLTLQGLGCLALIVLGAIVVHIVNIIRH